jgi:2'-5' RNA ligase
MPGGRPTGPGVPIGRAWPSRAATAPDGPSGPGLRDGPPNRNAPTRRLFVAVPLGEDALRAVTDLVVELQADSTERRAAASPSGRRAGIRWVRPEGTHVTLRFLGPTPSWLVDDARAAIEEAAQSFGPFAVRLAGAGAFPRLSAPRVLWLGIGEGADRLAEIAGSLQAELARAGWEPEGRPFSAHLTLARCDDVTVAGPIAEALVRRAAGLRVGWTADRVVLYESHPGPGGSRYEVVADVPLVR